MGEALDLASSSMSIALLKTLITVADAGSFAAAAVRIGVSQAAVGQQMQRLEALTGQTLFDRSGSRPELTADGRDMASRARDVIEAYDGLVAPVPAQRPLSGELTLGAVPSTLTELVPAAIKRMMTAHPDLQVRIVSALSVDLLDQVERGALDAAVTSSPASLGALKWYPLVREPLVLIKPETLSGDDPKTLLTTAPYIRHTRRADAGLLADTWLRRNRVAVRGAMELESLEAVARMVAQGLGVALVPDICRPGTLFDGVARIPLGAEPPGRALGVLSREAGRLISELNAQLAGLVADV